MIRCSRWKFDVTGRAGTLATTRCCRDGKDFRAQVICYPGGGRCFGYVWTPRWIEMQRGPTFRRTAIRLMSAVRRREG